SNPELLDALAADFVAHGYDLRGLIRTILSSRTYQLSSRTNATNRDDPNFSHAAVRRLSAEQMLDSIVLETGVGGVGYYYRTFDLPITFPAGSLRAQQVPDGQIGSSFLDLFGKPPRETACTCERQGDASVTQALHLMNGETLEKRLRDPKGQVARLSRGLT